MPVTRLLLQSGWSNFGTAHDPVPYGYQAPTDLYSHYHEVDLFGRATFRPQSSRSYDIDSRDWYGASRNIARALRQEWEVIFFELDGNEVEILRRWEAERRPIAVNGNYGPDTTFLHYFQRPSIIDNSVGQIIGRSGWNTNFTTTFNRDTSAGTDIATREVAGGYSPTETQLTIPTADDVPRYVTSWRGLNGILLESESKNEFSRAHPISGTLVWSSGTGAPSIGITSQMPSHVYGLSPNQVLAASLTSVSDSITVNMGSAQDFAGGDNVTFSVYLCGYGKVKLRASGSGVSSGPVTGSSITLTQGWQRYQLLFTHTDDANTVTLEVIGDLANTRLYVGGAQLEANPMTSYINSVTSLEQTRAQDVLTVPGFVMNEHEGTALFGIGWPQNTFAYDTNWPATYPDEYEYLMYNKTNGHPNGFALKWHPGDKKWTFHKSVETTKVVSSTRVTAPGVSQMIGVNWNDDDKYEIFQEGVSIGSQSVSTIHALSTGLTIGGGGHPTQGNPKRGFSGSIAFIRIDAKIFDQTWNGANAWLYDTDQFAFDRQFIGREFRITDLRPSINEADHTKFNGRLRLEEVNSVEQAVHGGR